jgi:hypothetical protein
VPAAVPVVHLADLAQRPLTLVGCHDRDVGARGDQVEQSGPVEVLPVPVGRAVDPAEVPVIAEQPHRVAVLLLVADQQSEPAYPRDALVAHVPDHREHPSGAEHAGDLGQRACPVEPVERLRRDHHVDRPRRHRDAFGGTAAGVGGGDAGVEQAQHPVVGIGGDHLVTEGDDLLGELARAGAELEHASRLRADQPGDALGRVRRAGPVVAVGGVAEAQPLACHRGVLPLAVRSTLPDSVAL